MFNFEKINSPQKLNRDFILSKIPDHQLFYYYFGPFNLKDLYPSKFGSGKHRDRNHSTGFYISSSGKIIYNHFNGLEPKMDAFAFVCRLYGCSFSDALKRIAADFGLVSGIANPMADKARTTLETFDRNYKKETKIHIIPTSFDSQARDFWKPYGITKDELKREGVYQIKKLFINEKFIPNDDNSLRFALTVPFKDELLIKVYSPGSNLKWISNIPLDIPFGLDTIKKPGKCSFGAKAQKDRIIILKFLPSVLAYQNESKSAISKKVRKMLAFNFQENWNGFDNDETGLETMQELETDGFKSIHVPIELAKEGIKDFSDLAKEKGLDAVEQLLKQNGLI